MKFLNNLTSKQLKSIRVCWRSPVIVFLLLGSFSSSLGYHVALKENFFQVSKADAISPSAAKEAGKGALKAIFKGAQQTAKNLPARRSISQRFQAIPISDEVLAFRVPGHQAKEDPSVIGQLLKLDKDEPYNAIEVVHWGDRKFLRLYSKNPDEAVYIDADIALCTIPGCLGTLKDIEEDPSNLSNLRFRANVIANNIRDHYRVGW